MSIERPVCDRDDKSINNSNPRRFSRRPSPKKKRERLDEIEREKKHSTPRPVLFHSPQAKSIDLIPRHSSGNNAPETTPARSNDPTMICINHEQIPIGVNNHSRGSHHLQPLFLHSFLLFERVGQGGC